MKDKIVIKLQGGLGNQLFQYAYAKRMQQLFPEKQIILDVSYFQEAHIRSLELQKLSIDENVEWSEKKQRFFDMTYTAFKAEKSLLGKIGKRLKSWPLMEKAGYYFNYSGSDYWTPRKNLKNIHLAGYFQNEEQIRPVREHLCKAIVPKDGLSATAEGYLSEIRAGNSIGISVRAGRDYEEMGWKVCTKAFYLAGLHELIKDEKKRRVFVFSDCIDKIREENWFAGFDVTFVENCTTAEGLFLLSQCDDFVIANSTFSWWGAYLSESKEKKVFAPDVFIGDVRTADSGLHVLGFCYLDNLTGETCEAKR